MVSLIPDLAEYTRLPPITACFQNVLKQGTSKQSLVGNQSIPASRNLSQSKRESVDKNTNDNGSGKRRLFKRRSEESKDSSGETDEDSSGSRSGKMPKLRRKFRYHPLQSHQDRNAPVKAESDSDDDDLNNLLKNLDVDEANATTGFQLCVLILNILQDLCVHDLREGLSGQIMSPGFLPGLLQCLVSLDAEQKSEELTEWEKQAKLVIKLHLTRVVLLSCGITSCQQNGVNIVRGHRVIEQIFNTVIPTGQSFDGSFFENLRDLDEHKLDMFLMCDCSLGVLVCLTALFQNLPFNPSFIKSALCLTEEFQEHNGFKMLEKCILFADWLKSQPCSLIGQFTVLEDEPVKVMGTFLTTLKVVRVNYLHYVKCVKRKHQKCSYSHYFDHHHDILGVAMGTIKELEQENLTLTKSRSTASSLKHQTSQTVTCLVSSSTQFLLDLLNKVVSKVTKLELLKTVYCTGICCCMSLDDIVSTFVKNMEKFSPAVRTYAADILNKIILEHFSGKSLIESKDVQKAACSFCDEPSVSSVHDDYPRERSGAFIVKPCDSGIDSSDLNAERKKMDLYKVTRWSSVAQLKDLLYSKNEELAISTAKHLMVLAIKGNAILKAELFFSLYKYSLENVKKPEQSSTHAKVRLSKSVQVHCLSALPFLLQSSDVTKGFLSMKGVRKLCELTEDDTLRGPVLRIFEALVVLDEQRGHKSDRLWSYEGGRVIDSFISELSKRSFSDDSTYFDDSDVSKSKINKDCVVLSKFSLPVLVDLWETCAKLCLHSRLFVSQFKEMQCLLKTEGLLLETLDIIMSPALICQLKSQGSVEAEDSGMEGETTADTEKENQGNFYKRVSLLESLMSVVGACNMNRDLDVSTERIDVSNGTNRGIFCWSIHLLACLLATFNTALYFNIYRVQLPVCVWLWARMFRWHYES